MTRPAAPARGPSTLLRVVRGGVSPDQRSRGHILFRSVSLRWGLFRTAMATNPNFFNLSLIKRPRHCSSSSGRSSYFQTSSSPQSDLAA